MGFGSNLRISMAVCALNCCAAAAVGQTATTEAGSALEEIVVTADKRAERLQDVPASVVAITSEQLKRQNIRDFDDLIDVAPNLTITKTSQPGNNSINMRGVGTYSLSIASQFKQKHFHTWSVCSKSKFCVDPKAPCSANRLTQV
jgi:iron complex outermembrane receptor protein